MSPGNILPKGLMWQSKKV